MSTQAWVSSATSGNPDLLSALHRYKNVWFEQDADTDPAGLRWVALALEPEQLEVAQGLLGDLGGQPTPQAPTVYAEAAITHLYADGRAELIPIVQVEFAVRFDQIVGLLDRLENAGLLGRSKDRMVVIRGLVSALSADCQIFPASSRAPYAHFIRWRHRPQGNSVAAAISPGCIPADTAANEEFSEVIAVC